VNRKFETPHKKVALLLMKKKILLSSTMTTSLLHHIGLLDTLELSRLRAEALPSPRLKMPSTSVSTVNNKLRNSEEYINSYSSLKGQL
jgi:hypothetical protein